MNQRKPGLPKNVLSTFAKKGPYYPNIKEKLSRGFF